MDLFAHIVRSWPSALNLFGKAVMAGLLISCCAVRASAATPPITYGSYFGGAGDETSPVLALGPTGEIIIAGTTTSPSLPGTERAYQRTKATGFQNYQDAFIGKVDRSGRKLIWTTFLGGDGDDQITAITVDSGGNIYVAGTTRSSNFPIQSAVSCATPDGFFFSTPFQQKCTMGLPKPDLSYSFIAKFAPDGSRMLNAIQLPGVTPTALTVNASDEPYVATSGLGVTGSDFLFRLNAAGTSLIFGAFIAGGTNTLGSYGTSVTAVKTDSSGNCYVVGSIAGGQLPTTANAIQASDPNANLPIGTTARGFILKVDALGSRALYGTYFGARFSKTKITSMALTPDGALLFSGTTDATSFQASSEAFLNVPSQAFIAKLTPGSTGIDAFSYLPAQPGILAVDNQIGQASVQAGSQLLHLRSNTLGNASSSFVFNASGFLISDLAIDSTHSVWAVGSCFNCSNVISTDAYGSMPGGNSDVILVQVDGFLNQNGASFDPSGQVASDSIVTATGRYLASGAPSQNVGAPPFSLGGTTVIITDAAAVNRPCPIFYVSQSQVNYLLPPGVAPGVASIKITAGDGVVTVGAVRLYPLHLESFL